MKYIAVLSFLITAPVVYSQKIDYDRKIDELGITLITPTKPVANYVKAVRVGNLLFLSGHGPGKADGTSYTGRIGKDVNTEDGYTAARQAGISLLSTIKAELGSLNKVKRVVKVHGMVNCISDFTDQSKVINGCSDLMVAVFGENGKHARAAVGMNSLPNNITVEIEMVIEVQ